MCFYRRPSLTSLLSIYLLVVSITLVHSVLIYPDGSGVGYITAVAIPVNGLPNRKIYLAFNFEAHFAVPTVSQLDNLLFWRKFLLGERKREIRYIDYDSRIRNVEEQGSIYTRKNFYRLAERHLTSAGYNGTGCLLRTICETSENPYYEYNGVFGNVFHILFTPSSSKNERLAKMYSEAESHGRKSNCQRYHQFCETNLLDLVSRMVSYYTTVQNE